ncbi:DinB family protein [Planomicrobium sp. CPCC 101110]|uniref:DinB family protein n=1 Tax=Planomicrobium sp. CPCC 101110 TaxID=2599619 RepID=UPI0011B76063|nr:DinB family protein [Planomicrobium sp. CPCC 101110]TWT25197.1 DinB family protein [Planomicrobium sp. CPCC 101110]
MNFKLEEAIEILERTPASLEALLSGLSPGWLHSSEGEGTWNPSQVIGHLIEGEKNDWIPRLEMILQEGETKPFSPFDRFAHLKENQEKPVEEKLQEFKNLRLESIARLKQLVSSETQLELAGLHPDFGPVKLRELLSTWVVHDFTHISQIVRTMAERYREDVGPWEAYLGVLKRNPKIN